MCSWPYPTCPRLDWVVIKYTQDLQPTLHPYLHDHHNINPNFSLQKTVLS